METENNNHDEQTMRQVDIWASLVGTAIALAMAVIVYIRRKKLPVPDSFKKWIEPLKLTLDFLNGQAYAGPAIENAMQLDSAQLRKLPGLYSPPPAMTDTGNITKKCGCLVPDTTCDCPTTRNCGCSKEPPGAGPKIAGNLPDSLLASNRRKQTDTFLAVKDKGKSCGFYRLTAFNPSGPKFRIRRKLGGGFSVSTAIDDSGPADGNYTIISPTEPLPDRYVVEIQRNGAYIIQNSEKGTPLENLEEGDYTFIPVHVVPTKSPDSDESPNVSSHEIDKSSKDSKTSKGSQESRGSKSSKQDDVAGSKGSQEAAQSNSQEVADIRPDTSTEQAAKLASDTNGQPTEPPSDEPLKPSAYYVQHTALPGMYKFNYCDTRPDMGPRPVIDGVYPLWDRDAAGNSVPSNRPDGIYILEWVELETPVDETNVHLPQPVAERIVSVVSESKPDGTNVTTVTRKLTPVKGLALNVIYPGGLPPGLQPNVPQYPYGMPVCGCIEPIQKNFQQDNCLCIQEDSTKCDCKSENTSFGSEILSGAKIAAQCNCSPSEQLSKSQEKKDGDCNCNTEDGISETSHERTQWASLEVYHVSPDDKSTIETCNCGKPNASQSIDQTKYDSHYVTDGISIETEACNCAKPTTTQSSDQSRRMFSDVIPGCSRASDDTTFNSTVYHQLAPFSGQSCGTAQYGAICGQQQFEADLSAFGATSTPIKSQGNKPRWSPDPRGGLPIQSDLPDWCRQPLRNISESDPQSGAYTFMTNDQSVGPSGPSTPTRWMTAPMHIPNVPDCCKVNLNTCENQPAKHVQSIKPNQVIQVQPGINIVRRDDNNDVDVVVEMDIDPECTDANASIANTAGHTGNQTRNR